MIRLLRGGFAGAAAAARRCLARLWDLAAAWAGRWMARQAAGAVLDAAGLDPLPALDQFPGHWALSMALASVLAVLARLWQAAARARRRARAGRARAEGGGDDACCGACGAPAGERVEACPGREGCHRPTVVSVRVKGGRWWPEGHRAKHFRRGLTLVELVEMFPDDGAAEDWFASVRWPQGATCPRRQPGRRATSPPRGRRSRPRPVAASR